MSQQLWNQGRVVGYSGYELYVKSFLEKYPGQSPASERQWMSSMLGMGASMLCKITADTITGPHYRDIPLPELTSLVACNTIVANLFVGHGVYEDTSVWATRVKDYGQLLDNGSSNAQPIDNWSKDERKQLSSYMRIVDGLILQPGEWFTATATPPEKDLIPDISKVPTLRIFFSDKVPTEFEILLTGFTSMKVAAGSVALDGSTLPSGPVEEGVPRAPDNDSGDFLGPAEFPWANKVIFAVPSAAMNYFMIQKYKRTVTSGGDGQKQVDATAVIDMDSCDPGEYYKGNNPEAREPISVNFHTSLGDKNAVITIWSRSTKYPPALWGTLVSDTGETYLNPLDIVATGSVKMFDQASQAQLWEYQQTYPGTFAISREADGRLEALTPGGLKIPIADLGMYQLRYNSVGGSRKAYALSISAGTKTYDALAYNGYTFSDDANQQKQMADRTSVNVGKQSKITPATSNINWAMLLSALANDKSIDILGDDLKAVKVGLASNPPYIPFKGVRLYISSTKPTGDIPEGSIGIGWG